ncbi:hypothetical protein [Belnapia rosea]|uniref:Uncharacterized protein n=1 Tax=Belnapia rosea TaxID=938405 RepID=A0A1G7BZI2_9PROT|nr:hypothetical protein [Belnapia rosea]SDE32472.1 hypothetical protein SAMN04487779_102827 [Belnapia rosea]
MARRELEEGERVGRFVVLRDVEGRMHAVSATSIGAICEDDGGALLLLPGGRMIRVERSFEVVLGWLELGGR